MREKMCLSVGLQTVKLEALALKCDCSEALAKIMQRSVDACCKQVQVNNSPGGYQYDLVYVHWMVWLKGKQAFV